MKLESWKLNAILPGSAMYQYSLVWRILGRSQIQVLVGLESHFDLFLLDSLEMLPEAADVESCMICFWCNNTLLSVSDGSD